ncbi:MAG TPA: DUF1844 domain-containing protein [Actinomycetota bacterium]
MTEDADQIQQMREQLTAVSAGDVVAEAAAQLVTFAYLRLGLPAEQNAEYRDLDAARLLIDAFGGLLEATEGRLGAYEPELAQALASLRLNYAELLRREQQPGEPPPPEGGEGEEDSRLHRPPSGLWVPGQP